jgi:nucleoside 2-deoxyribosyltransferase
MIVIVRKVHNYLDGARVYLAGPMDFVASREVEKRSGWRTRVKEFLRRFGVTVFDPWEKPRIRGLFEYGKEDAKTVRNRERWTFAPTPEGAATRAELAEYFWETVHIYLRMVDISDFVIAYCPTDVYSVGTVHEIIVARSQHKPVLFVSPPTERNPGGTPSLWYLPLVGSESFFDGFGFREPHFLERFGSWRETSPLDAREKRRPPKRPLLPYLEELGRGTSVPKRWVHATRVYQDDDDWLLLEESLR